MKHSIKFILFFTIALSLTACKNSSRDHAQVVDPKRDGLYEVTAYSYDVSCPEPAPFTLAFRGNTLQEYQVPEADIFGEVDLDGFYGVVEGLDQIITFEGWYDGRNITGDWQYADGSCTGWFTGEWQKLP